MTFIYILYLEGGKYYVGKSLNPTKRIEDHKNGKGSSWTNKHKILEVLEVIETDEFDEDKYVKKYMRDYGIDNVRGGSYVSDSLTEEQVKLIRSEIRGATDCCSKCGSPSHFIANCTNVITKLYCSRCGRNNHNIKKCYVSKHKNGTLLTSLPSIQRPNTQIKYSQNVVKTHLEPVVKTPVVKTPEVKTPEVKQEQNWFGNMFNKISNEFVNPDSKLRKDIIGKF